MKPESQSKQAKTPKTVVTTNKVEPMSAPTSNSQRRRKKKKTNSVRPISGEVSVTNTLKPGVNSDIVIIDLTKDVDTPLPTPITSGYASVVSTEAVTPNNESVSISKSTWYIMLVLSILVALVSVCYFILNADHLMSKLISISGFLLGLAITFFVKSLKPSVK